MLFDQLSLLAVEVLGNQRFAQLAMMEQLSDGSYQLGTRIKEECTSAQTILISRVISRIADILAPSRL
jgi:hypothetical protein